MELFTKNPTTELFTKNLKTKIKIWLNINQEH